MMKLLLKYWFVLSRPWRENICKFNRLNKSGSAVFEDDDDQTVHYWYKEWNKGKVFVS